MTTKQQLNGHLEIQATQHHISDGTYRIKSNIDGLYLTYQQNAAPVTVIVRKSEPSSVSQRVRHHFI